MYDYLPNHRVFISYHHFNDQTYKNAIINKFAGSIFTDMSVDTGGINDDLPDDRIREIIRDDYLRDSSVTILLVGTETMKRKHIDWELYSSMYNGAKNKKSGLLIINLPSISHAVRATGEEEKSIISQGGSWGSSSGYKDLYPYMPERIIDNFKQNVHISVVDYSTIINSPEGFKKLIDFAYQRRTTHNYDLSRPMRRRNG